MEPKVSVNGSKFPCPACGHRQSAVHGWRGITGTDATDTGRPLYRRLRRCLACRQRYTTIEVIERVLVTRKKSSAA